jgi:HlyD family secretion protein
MKRRTLIFLIILAAIIAAAIVYSMASKDTLAKPLETEVKQGKFEIVVTVTGELQAQTSTDINAPLLLRSRELRLHRIQIQDLIAEGTVVDSGDYVATLDRSEADNSYKDISDELEVRESDYTKTKLDTTIQLRELRDEMINLKFNMEEAEITLEQSQFEPPTTIRQAKINLDKAERAYEQAVKNYQLKVQQAKADMTEVTVDLAKQRRRKEQMEDVLQKFVIHAPAPGMVIYKREWSGQKRTVGSEISPWDLTVATLPDMSTMVSKTYVNEIDISKIKVGQKVRAGVDAFPEKQYTGVVSEVANIGEQLPNTDAKVFEVVIKLNESDPILRPSMTTSNSIVTKIYDSVLYVPLEAVHSNDSMTYVYLKNNTRQVVVLDESNENEIIVEAGLKAGDKVLLSVPEGAEEMKFTGLELVEVIRQKEAEKKRLEEELQKQREEEHLQKSLRRGMQPQEGAQPTGARPAGNG